jgi:predicted peptidase
MKNSFYILSFFLWALLAVSSQEVKAQDFSLYEKKWLVQGSDTLPYRILLPEKFDSAKSYPVIFFLHGAGERGNDNEKQLTHGAGLFLRSDVRKNFPAIVVFPQCSRNDYWSNVLRHHDSKGNRRFRFLANGGATQNMSLLQLLINLVMDDYRVKKEQVYIGGLSMGAMGTFELVRRMPGVFAAAFAICGGADPATASQLAKTKWWIFHGGKDDVVPPKFSEQMVAALKKVGAKPKFTFYPDANHNSWDAAFAENDLIPWLFAQKIWKQTQRANGEWEPPVN